MSQSPSASPRSSMTDEILSQLSMPDLAARLGTDEATARAATEAALPTLLAGMTNQAVDPQRAPDLARAVQSDHDSAVLDTDDPVAHVDPAEGDRIVQHVFGEQRPTVESRLQAAAGTGGDDLMGKLLPMLAPLVMAWLSRKMMGGGTGGGATGGGGGLGDILGDVLGGAAGGASGGAGSGGSGGGLGDILGDVLGGGSADAGGSGSSTSSGGGGLGGMLGEVLSGGSAAESGSATSPSTPAGRGGGGLGDVLGQLGGRAGSGGGLDDLLGSILGGNVGG